MEGEWVIDGGIFNGVLGQWGVGWCGDYTVDLVVRARLLTSVLSSLAFVCFLYTWFEVTHTDAFVSYIHIGLGKWGVA